MPEIKYKVVSDNLRTEPRSQVHPEWMDKVIEGKTIELGVPQARLGAYYKTFKRQGYKLRTRSVGPEATVIWVVPMPEGADGE